MSDLRQPVLADLKLENPHYERPWTLGLDLGQQNDFSALCAIKKPPPDPDGSKAVRHRPLLHLAGLKRFELGTPYTEIARVVRDYLDTPDLKGHADLVIDATGLGQPMVDIFHELGVKPICVTITGGNAPSGGGLKWSVPKYDLVFALRVLFEQKRLLIFPGLDEAEHFTKELMAFKFKQNKETGRGTYEAAKAGDHDDLVLSVAMAVWKASRLKRTTPSGLNLPI